MKVGTSQDDAEAKATYLTSEGGFVTLLLVPAIMAFGSVLARQLLQQQR